MLMYDYLNHFHINTYVIATKADKVGKTHLTKHIKKIKTKLNTENVLTTSSEKKQGIHKIIELIG